MVERILLNNNDIDDEIKWPATIYLIAKKPSFWPFDKHQWALRHVNLKEHDLLYANQAGPTLTPSSYQRLTAYLEEREKEAASRKSRAFNYWTPPNAAVMKEKAK